MNRPIAFWARSLGAGVAFALLLPTLSLPQANAASPHKTDSFAALAQEAVRELTGKLSVVWGDGKPGSGYSQVLYFLHLNDGVTIQLEFSEKMAATLNPSLAFTWEEVTVRGVIAATQTPQASEATLPLTMLVQEIVPPAPPESTTFTPTSVEGVSGSKPWISVLCKFSDQPAEPKPLSYFQNMYANTYPGLDHYWRAVSYNKVNLAGSTAVGWFTLPHPKAYYITSESIYLYKLAQDCASLADPFVNFPGYVGINLMFNDTIGCCAWGGQMPLTLENITMAYRVTWEPPWGYENIGVMMHEMGHGFGLPHSSGNYGLVYDNQWDVMSDAWSACGRGGKHIVYGCLGQHTIAYHKGLLGWITPTLIYTVTPGARVTLTLNNLASGANSGYLMVKMPQGGQRFKTIEARRLVGYDSFLPGDAVIVHEVDPNRAEPAHIVDVDNNSNTGDDGAMWLPGESFDDIPNRVRVTVLNATAGGFRISITPLNNIRQLFLPAVLRQLSSDIYEPDNIPAQAKPLMHNQAQLRNIYPVGDVDWAVFTVNARSAITLETYGLPNTPNTDDTHLWLYNAGLTLLDFNDDISWPQNLYSRITRQCNTNPLPAGTYYARVDEYENNNVIYAYYLKVTITPCP